VLATLAFGGQWLDALASLGSNQARTSHLSLPGATATALSALASGSALDYHAATRLVAALAWFASCGWLLWRTWRGHDPFAMAGWSIVLLLCATAWLVPWYLLWALPLVAVAQARRLFAASVILSGWMLAIAVPL
jgi:hypothetical protein